MYYSVCNKSFDVVDTVMFQRTFISYQRCFVTFILFLLIKDINYQHVEKKSLMHDYNFYSIMLQYQIIDS